MRQAKIYNHNLFVGVLTEDENGYTFQYDADYLQSLDAEYVIAFMFPRITKSLLLSIRTFMYSLNSENGGFVTTISACFKSSIHSSLRKSPFPLSFLTSFDISLLISSDFVSTVAKSESQ